MTTQPKAIFFDLDETLIKNQIPIRDLFARMYHDFEKQLGVENKDCFFSNLKSSASKLWETMFETEISPEQQFINCFEQSVLVTGALPAKQSKELARDMFNHFLDLSSHNVALHDGALDTLAELSNRGVITGLITNGMERLQLGKIHQLKLQDKVDHVTVSAQARAHKPHRPVFDLALSRANVNANQAWQIGDHATNDVAGAIRAGMSGVFYNPNSLKVEDSFADLRERPTHVIKHLSEVLELSHA